MSLRFNYLNFQAKIYPRGKKLKYFALNSVKPVHPICAAPTGHNPTWIKNSNYFESFAKVSPSFLFENAFPARASAPSPEKGVKIHDLRKSINYQVLLSPLFRRRCQWNPSREISVSFSEFSAPFSKSPFFRPRESAKCPPPALQIPPEFISTNTREPRGQSRCECGAVGVSEKKAKDLVCIRVLQRWRCPTGVSGSVPPSEKWKF